jgi:hypothetical protein
LVLSSLANISGAGQNAEVQRRIGGGGEDACDAHLREHESGTIVLHGNANFFPRPEDV